ncbi:hypothetical protein PR202_gb15485 [Eleusine coracana subsp. coracana]|uniref:F-box domain-containing protein n=1 Tax=Eleusine coracana subsp. coracana TaxID=191504 RepID=A0AAV5EYH3_ELECO|nr:hypothetical protein PR202_gb15485 [Eleusine coracana subsp. coracana]
MKRGRHGSGYRGSFGRGKGWQAKRARRDGGWRRGEPVARWSHPEAMKKPTVGGYLIAAGGGGWSGLGEVLAAEKAGLGGSSWGSTAFGTSSWDAAANKAAGGGDGGSSRVRGWPEPEAKKTKPRGGDEEEAPYDWRWTEAVGPEILALVLRGRVPADEVARSVAGVCRAWRAAVASPDMWGDVDIEAWCRRVNCRAKADAAVRRLVARAQGTLRRLSAYRIGDAAFTRVAASGKLLNVLQIPMSDVTDGAVEKHAECLPALRVLDISNCLKITSRGIEALGRHCKLLVQLKRNMPPPELPMGNNAAAKVVQEEALAVANTMPMLQQLELAYGLFSDIALDAVLNKCPLLRTLDILGCWNVRLDGDIEERCCPLESFREPWVPEYSTGSSSEGDYSDSGGDGDY